MRAGSLYFVKCWLGASPYPLARILAGQGQVCLRLVFLLSLRLESQLIAGGMPEIYKFKRLAPHRGIGAEIRPGPPPTASSSRSWLVDSFRVGLATLTEGS